MFSLDYYSNEEYKKRNRFDQTVKLLRCIGIKYKLS